MNQFQESDVVINWLKNINNNSKCMFMQFVIEEVYPLISKDRLFKRIDYTEGFVSIINDKIKINMSSRQSLGFSGSDVWIKSDYAKGFAITMGSFKESKILKYFIF